MKRREKAVKQFADIVLEHNGDITAIIGALDPFRKTKSYQVLIGIKTELFMDLIENRSTEEQSVIFLAFNTEQNSYMQSIKKAQVKQMSFDEAFEFYVNAAEKNNNVCKIAEARIACRVILGREFAAKDLDRVFEYFKILKYPKGYLLNQENIEEIRKDLKIVISKYISLDHEAQRKMYVDFLCIKCDVRLCFDQILNIDKFVETKSFIKMCETPRRRFNAQIKLSGAAKNEIDIVMKIFDLVDSFNSAALKYAQIFQENFHNNIALKNRLIEYKNSNHYTYLMGMTAKIFDFFLKENKHYMQMYANFVNEKIAYETYQAQEELNRVEEKRKRDIESRKLKDDCGIRKTVVDEFADMVLKSSDIQKSLEPYRKSKAFRILLGIDLDLFQALISEKTKDEQSLLIDKFKSERYMFFITGRSMLLKQSEDYRKQGKPINFREIMSYATINPDELCTSDEFEKTQISNSFANKLLGYDKKNQSRAL